MPPGTKMLKDGAERRQKTLRMTRRLKPLHAIFSLACRAMRMLTAVVEITTLAVFHPRQDLALRCPVALELLRDDLPWHVLQPLEQLAKELLRRVPVAAALHQNVEDVVVLVNRAPQGIA